MPRSSPHQINDLFDRVVELDPDSRSAILDEACAEDPALRREVVSLLTAYDDHADDRGRALESLRLPPLQGGPAPMGGGIGGGLHQHLRDLGQRHPDNNQLSSSARLRRWCIRKSSCISSPTTVCAC